MIEKKEQARKMFFDYACNHFFMEHDGVGEQYRQFGISEPEEKEWRREYISYGVSHLSVDDLAAVDHLRDAWASEALPDLIRHSDKGDAFAKLWYANAIWELAYDVSITMNQRRQAISTAIQLWRSLVSSPIDLSDNHKAKIESILDEYPTVLDASTPEEYILNYAKQQLAEAKAKRQVM